MKTPSKPRNLVHKYSVEFNKPKTFRNRKKKAKMDGDYSERPKHQPYKRSNADLISELYYDQIKNDDNDW